jgi:hypothetical protein
MTAKHDATQGSLFPRETLRLLTERGSPNALLPPAPVAPPPWEQLDLFAEPVVL